MEKNRFFAEKLKTGFREHELMRNHTTIQVGGVADYYFNASSVDEIIRAVKAANEIKLPYFILGSGSNIVFSDYGFPGLVIKNKTNNISFMIEKSQVIVDAGVTLGQLISEATSHNLAGLEFLYGIPGTIGGAIYGDAGAYGQSIGDYVKSATVLVYPDDSEKDAEIIQVDTKWFEFGYRSSKLKKLKNNLKKPVILTVRLQLSQSRQEEIIRRINISKEKRWATQPIGKTAGCVFKNPIPEELIDVSGRGSRNMPELPKERTAGFMLDRSGAKKLKVGDVKVSPKHANFLLNTGQAKASEVRTLIENMRSAVQNKYDISLEEEIEYVGQW